MGQKQENRIQLRSSLTYLHLALLLFAFVLIYSCSQLNSGNSEVGSSEIVTSKEKRPNVLFIMVDDLRPELSCYGKKEVHSTVLEKLSTQSLVFDRAYVQYPLCNPSRASIMTGLRPDFTGVLDNQAHFRDSIPKVITLPENFAIHGYKTTGIGKIYHGWNRSGKRMDDYQSWTEPSWFSKRNGNPRGYVTQKSLEIIRANKKISAAYPVEVSVNPDALFEDGKITNAAISKLNEWKDEQFFLAVGFKKPHLPFTVPKKYWDLYEGASVAKPAVSITPKEIPAPALIDFSELRRYLGVPKNGPVTAGMKDSLQRGYVSCVSFIDAQIGKLLAELEKLELDKQTIVVFLGDHGFKLGDYGRWTKHSNFEIDTKVPLMFRLPDQSTTGRTNQMVELIDLFPTLCDLAGIPSPKQLQGSSLIGLFDSRHQPPDKEFAISLINRKNHTGYSLRTEQYRFNKWIPKKGGKVQYELYNHYTDFNEEHNLASVPSYKTIIRKYNQMLKKEMAQWKEPVF